MTVHWDVRMDFTVQHVGEPQFSVLYWDFSQPMRAIASAPLGGGIGERSWVFNAQVPSDYTRTDIDVHLEEIAGLLGASGAGVGFLTAASVERFAHAHEDLIQAFATVGLQHPTWAASDEDAESDFVVGTINLVVVLPVRIDDSALVNAVGTATEAKTQALVDLGVPGTGTASDSLCILTPPEGPIARFAGPRSGVGSRIARAVHRAVLEGANRS